MLINDSDKNMKKFSQDKSDILDKTDKILDKTDNFN